MSFAELLDAVQKLSRKEKLELIEAIAQMLQQELDTTVVQSVSETAAPYVTDKLTIMGNAAEIDFDEATDESFDAILHAHLNSPDPEPHQMLPYGLFKGANYAEEDFRAAEWHPSSEDIAGA